MRKLVHWSLLGHTRPTRLRPIVVVVVVLLLTTRSHTNRSHVSNIFTCVVIYSIIIFVYTEYAGLEIYVNLRMASSFSRQIANGNAGPTSALESMGPKPTFRCHSVNIALIYKL